MTITAGTTVQFTRWQALGWTAPPAPFKVVDTRGEGDHLELFDGERWGPAKHYELVDTPAGDPEPDYGRIAWAAATGMEARRYDGSHHAWDDAAAAVIAAYRAAHPEPAMSRGEAWLDGYEVGEAEGYGRGQTDARAAHPEPQPVTRQQIVEALNSVFYSDQRPIIPHAADAVLALFASPAPVPLLLTQEAIADVLSRTWNEKAGHLSLVDARLAQADAFLDLLGRTQPEPVRAALICGACGHEWTAHDDSGCARGLCRCDEPCPDPLPPAAGVQEPTPERPEHAFGARVLVDGMPATVVGVFRRRDGSIAYDVDGDDESFAYGSIGPERLAAPPPVSAPEPEPAPTSPLAFMDRCPTCDLPAEGAPDGAQVCSDGFHRAAAPELTPDRPTKRPRPVRLFPGQELTVAAPSPDQAAEGRAEWLSDIAAWTDERCSDAVARRTILELLAEIARIDAAAPSPDPEADDGRRQAVIEAAKEWYAAGGGGSDPDGRLHRANRILRRTVTALAALEETDR